MKKLEKYKNWGIAFVFAVAVIAVYKTFDNFYKVTEFIKIVVNSLSPFLIGFILAYILNIPATKIEDLCKKSKYAFVSKRSKGISILSVYLLLALVVYLGICALAPALYRNVVELYYNIPGYISQAMSTLENFQMEHGINIFEFNEANIMNALDKIFGKFDITEFAKYAKGVINITSGVVNAFIGIIVSVYMLSDKEKIVCAIKRILKVILKEEKSEKVINVAKKMAVLATIVLSVLRVKYAIILGVMIGLFNLIPYFGAIIAVSLSVIITLITGGIAQGIWALVLLIVVQQADANFIGPKIMGEVLDASPLWIILAVTLGGGLFGVGGMIVSVPILVTVKMAVTELINEKEAEQSED